MCFLIYKEKTLYQLVSNLRVIADLFTIPITWLKYVIISPDTLSSSCNLRTYEMGGGRFKPSSYRPSFHSAFALFLLFSARSSFRTFQRTNSTTPAIERQLAIAQRVFCVCAYGSCRHKTSERLFFLLGSRASRPHTLSILLHRHNWVLCGMVL